VGIDGRGSAILVHGSWGNPEDWRWVRDRLDKAGVAVAAPDLPTCRTADAGFLDDVASVRDTIRSVGLPVVVVGWSYGCDVVAAAAVGEAVTRLLFVSAVPVSLAQLPPTREEVLADPHLIDLSDGSYVLDNDWRRNEEAGTTFPHEVRSWLRAHPRRPMSWAARAPLTEAAWDTTPSTFLVGTAEPLLTPEERSVLDDGAVRARYDIRTIDTDHSLPSRRPEIVSAVVFEALSMHAGRG